MMQELYDRIVSEYRKSGSVDLTAKACGTYPIKVRKILITEGLWHSKKSDAVNALRNRGYSVREIAEELGMDEKNVQYYLPYTKSALSGEETDGGKRIQSFRERSRNVAESSISREKEMKGEGEVPSESDRESKTHEAIQKAASQPASGESSRESDRESKAHEAIRKAAPQPAARELTREPAPKLSASKTAESPELSRATSPKLSVSQTAEPLEFSRVTELKFREAWKGYLLHVELVENKYYDPEEDCEDIFTREKFPEVLRYFLKTKNGISRDLIVPGAMSLHQLSYALQKAFGFQNCHLHHFALPKKLLRQLTENKTGIWKDLCGVYLHAPVFEDFEDLYWDDDYRKGKSPAAWMRSKYIGDSVDYAVGETYIDTLRLMQEEKDWVDHQLQGVSAPLTHLTYDDLPLDIHARQYAPGLSLFRVLERLRIQEIFDMKPLPVSETENWREALRESIKTSRSYLEAGKDTLTFQSLVEALDTLRLLRTDRQALDRGIWLHRQEVKTELGRNPEEYLEELDWDILEMEHQLERAMHAFDPPAVPITDTLYYNYDYGDDWLLQVTCREIYVREEMLAGAASNAEKIFKNAGKKAGSRDPEMEKKLTDTIICRDFSDEYEYEDTEGNFADDDLRAALIRAELKKEPICVAAEGLPPVEDVGGISGFFEFLRTIHGEDAKEAANMRSWARGNGWKEVRPNPASLL